MYHVTSLRPRCRHQAGGRGARKAPDPKTRCGSGVAQPPAAPRLRSWRFRDHELWSECPLRITTRTHSQSR